MSPSESSLRSTVEDTVRRFSRSRTDDDRLLPPLTSAATAAAGSAIASGVHRWVRSRRPTLRRLVRGAAAGAGAAGILTAARILLRGGRPGPDSGLPAEVVDELLAGAGRGVLYAAVLDPFLPGPPAMRGALVGVADYLLAPWGGLFAQLRTLSPVAKLPVVGVLMEMGDAEDDPFLAFLLFGLALGLLTGDLDD
jgi:hypothetical protein